MSENASMWKLVGFAGIGVFAAAVFFMPWVGVRGGGDELTARLFDIDFGQDLSPWDWVSPLVKWAMGAAAVMAVAALWGMTDTFDDAAMAAFPAGGMAATTVYFGWRIHAAATDLNDAYGSSGVESYIDFGVVIALGGAALAGAGAYYAHLAGGDASGPSRVGVEPHRSADPRTAVPRTPLPPESTGPMFAPSQASPQPSERTLSERLGAGAGPQGLQTMWVSAAQLVVGDSVVLDGTVSRLQQVHTFESRTYLTVGSEILALDNDEGVRKVI